MLLELAIGDAYGAGFEYADEMVQFNNLAGFVQHPRHSTAPGEYTDDTQMSIAIAEAIVSGEQWTPKLLADAFVRVFKRDPRDGYARGFQAFLESIEDGDQFLRDIRPDSDKSGAAMRAGPVGVFSTVADVLANSTIQASLTHDTPDGIAAANAAALMTHYFLYRLGSVSHLGAFLDNHVPGRQWSEPWRGKVKSKGWMSVRAAVTALMRNNNLSLLLQDCIAFTGDVDTVATIALAAASCSEEYDKDLPTQLIAGLENGSYGRDYLIELDAALMTNVNGYIEE
jgi:ADP-ribosylglycohydrolase